MFSRFTIGAVAVPLLALAGAPGHSAEISAAKDGAALEAILSADEQTKDLVAARAADLGLALLSIRVGESGKETTELRVAGGGKPFRDCEAACPSMVVVPPSPKGFKIGSPESEPYHTDDETQVEVSVPAFAIGATEVTVAEYKACVAAGGCKPPEWLEPGGQHNIETGSSRYYRNLGDNLTAPEQPIVGVSQADATAYAAWLTSKTGHSYRLPSEAQWEFATRAGTKTAYWWGDTLPADGSAHAACVGCGSEWDAKAPAPANAFAPNPWGLFNVHGNVWEWTADFYCDDYASGPKDGSPRLTDDCPAIGDQPPARGVRSMRGGSVFYPAKIMRSAMRARNVPDFRNFSVGFRVARDMSP
jgi:formylglycine-generating enzyme required for sulfatase activity